MICLDALSSFWDAGMAVGGAFPANCTNINDAVAATVYGKEADVAPLGTLKWSRRLGWEVVMWTQWTAKEDGKRTKSSWVVPAAGTGVVPT